MEKNNQYALELTENELSLAKVLDGLASTGLACRDMENSFKKTLLSARCIQALREALTPQVMADFMSLQGSPLGFRTDKDKQGGYPMEVVREAVIAAAMIGLLPVGNQFNIISDRPYWTKEGFLYLLDNVPGLVYDVEFGVPKQGQSGALVHATVVWSVKGGEQKRMEWEIPVRVNAGQGADAVLGKAMRKALCKLYNKVTHSPLSDADVEDAAPPMKDVTPRWSGDVARERVAQSAAKKSGMAGAVPPAPARACGWGCFFEQEAWVYGRSIDKECILGNPTNL